MYKGLAQLVGMTKIEGPETIAQQWAGLGYLRPPDFRLACEEHAHLVALLRASGAEVLELPADSRTGLDSLYAHDPVLIADSGAIVFQMGKSARRGEGRRLAGQAVPARPVGTDRSRRVALIASGFCCFRAVPDQVARRGAF
jgi:hypothetical protein